MKIYVTQTPIGEPVSAPEPVSMIVDISDGVPDWLQRLGIETTGIHELPDPPTTPTESATVEAD